MKQKRKILIITRWFPPSCLVGGQRPLKLVQRLEQFGWEPIVLTAKDNCMGPIDAGLSRLVENCHVARVPCWSLWDHGQWWRMRDGFFKKALSLVNNKLAGLTGSWVPLDSSYPFAVTAVKKGVSLVRELEIDLIWATAPPVSSLELARRISLETGVPYVVDYRDVKTNFEGKKGNLARERAIAQSAAGITYVSPAHEPLLAANFPDTRAEKALIYNWFEPEERNTIAPQGDRGFTILHGGNLYGGRRNTQAFIQALVHYNQSNSSKPAQFLQYGLDKAAHLTREAEEAGGGDFVSVRPPLGRTAFLSACAGASVLLMVVGHDSGDQQHQGAIPGKLFDYFLTDKPILVVGPRKCLAGKIVVDYQRGLHVPDDEPSAIESAIKKLAGDPLKLGLDLSPGRIDDFGAPSVVASLTAFLNRIVAK